MGAPPAGRYLAEVKMVRRNVWKTADRRERRNAEAATITKLPDEKEGKEGGGAVD